jgi:hypothetical protein
MVLALLPPAPPRLRSTSTSQEHYQHRTDVSLSRLSCLVLSCAFALFRREAPLHPDGLDPSAGHD